MPHTVHRIYASRKIALNLYRITAYKHNGIDYTLTLSRNCKILYMFINVKAVSGDYSVKLNLEFIEKRDDGTQIYRIVPDDLSLQELENLGRKIMSQHSLPFLHDFKLLDIIPAPNNIIAGDGDIIIYRENEYDDI